MPKDDDDTQKPDKVALAPLLAGQRMLGVVKNYNGSTGFGFITCAETQQLFKRDVFLQRQEVVASGAKVGSTVAFTIELNKDGKPQARSVEVLSPEDDDLKYPSQAPSVDQGPLESFKEMMDAVDEYVESVVSEVQRFVGYIKSYNKEHGFGFVSCQDTQRIFGRDVFLHQSNLNGCWVGDAIRFRLDIDAVKGTPRAKDVTKAPAGTLEQLQASTLDARDMCLAAIGMAAIQMSITTLTSRGAMSGIVNVPAMPSMLGLPAPPASIPSAQIPVPGAPPTMLGSVSSMSGAIAGMPNIGMQPMPGMSAVLGAQSIGAGGMAVQGFSNSGVPVPLGLPGVSVVAGSPIAVSPPASWLPNGTIMPAQQALFPVGATSPLSTALPGMANMASGAPGLPSMLGAGITGLALPPPPPMPTIASTPGMPGIPNVSVLPHVPSAGSSMPVVSVNGMTGANGLIGISGLTSMPSMMDSRISSISDVSNPYANHIMPALPAPPAATLALETCGHKAASMTTKDVAANGTSDAQTRIKADAMDIVAIANSNPLNGVAGSPHVGGMLGLSSLPALPDAQSALAMSGMAGMAGAGMMGASGSLSSMATMGAASSAGPMDAMGCMGVDTMSAMATIGMGGVDLQAMSKMMSAMGMKSMKMPSIEKIQAFVEKQQRQDAAVKMQIEQLQKLAEKSEEKPERRQMSSGMPQEPPPDFDVKQRFVGIINKFNRARGFGFIKCDETYAAYGDDVFLHNEQREGFEVGDVVSFALEIRGTQARARDLRAARDKHDKGYDKENDAGSLDRWGAMKNRTRFDRFNPNDERDRRDRDRSPAHERERRRSRSRRSRSHDRGKERH